MLRLTDKSQYRVVFRLTLGICTKLAKADIFDSNGKTGRTGLMAIMENKDEEYIGLYQFRLCPRRHLHIKFNNS